MAQKLRALLLRYLPIIQVAVFVVIAAAYFLGGSEIGKRVLGVCLIVGALFQQVVGKIPYGWEGSEPSGYLTGWKMLLVNLTLVAVGTYFALFPRGLGG